MEDRIYYCGIQLTKTGIRPASNYTGRFSGGRKNGISHFNLSKEKRKNVDCVDCVSTDFIINDPFINKVLGAEVSREIKQIPSVFLEFRRTNDNKYEAIGIPICDSAGGYLGFIERIYAWDSEALPSFYAALKLSKANGSLKKTLEENIKKADPFNDAGIEELKQFVPDNILKTLNNELYLYHKEKHNVSLFHILKEKDNDENFADIVLKNIIAKITSDYKQHIEYDRLIQADKILKTIPNIFKKDNYFAQWLRKRFVEIEDKVNEYRIENPKPPVGKAKWEDDYEAYFVKIADFRVHELILNCMMQ